MIYKTEAKWRAAAAKEGATHFVERESLCTGAVALDARTPDWDYVGWWDAQSGVGDVIRSFKAQDFTRMTALFQ